MTCIDCCPLQLQPQGQQASRQPQRKVWIACKVSTILSQNMPFIYLMYALHVLSSLSMVLIISYLRIYGAHNFPPSYLWRSLLPILVSSGPLSFDNNGCHTLTAEADCLASADGRADFKQSPCHWCCGKACVAGGHKCAPYIWLLQQSSYNKESRNGVGYNSCPIPGMFVRMPVRLYACWMYMCMCNVCLYFIYLCIHVLYTFVFIEIYVRVIYIGE